MNEKRDAFVRLDQIVETLRGPEGCPWDRKQTLANMGSYLQEEAAEVIDAIEESGGQPSTEVCEELGDLLMNLLLASRICEESGAFSFADVANAIRDKLIRRHPHVFGGAVVNGADEVVKRWNEIKKGEIAARGQAGAPSRLDRVAHSLPALVRAWKLSAVAAEVGFDWPDPSGALAKLDEEVDEVRELLGEYKLGANRAAPVGGAEADSSASALEEEIGDVLFAAVNLARKVGVDPDRALRSALRKFDRRFRYVEAHVQDLEGASLEEMDRVWNQVRSLDRSKRSGA